MPTYTRPRPVVAADLRSGDEIAFTAQGLPLDDVAEVTPQTLWLPVVEVRVDDDDDETFFLDLLGLAAPTEWLRDDRAIIREPAVDQNTALRESLLDQRLQWNTTVPPHITLNVALAVFEQFLDQYPTATPEVIAVELIARADQWEEVAAIQAALHRVLGVST